MPLEKAKMIMKTLIKSADFRALGILPNTGRPPAASLKLSPEVAAPEFGDLQLEQKDRPIRGITNINFSCPPP